MTENELRQKVVGIAQKYIGCKESDGSHKKIIDIYNGHKPLARGYAVKYTDAWCSTFASAVAIAAGLTDIIPTECGCGEHIKLFQKLGSWQENDAYVPSPGDYIFYDWDDSGSGDNTGNADHVGIVEKVSGSTITVIEGNYSDSVKRRTLAVNGRYIRGYGVPKYSSKATGAATPGSFKVGDEVNFTGTKHYVSSSAVNAASCKPGPAKVTAIASTGKHPYHLVRVAGKGSTVYGWVDTADIAAAPEASQQASGGNSPLVNYTKISPNRSSPRNHAIDTITIHCVVGQCTVETLGNIFAPKSREASSNYGIGLDGRIGMYVEEKDRSWCSSNAANDNRAITIEVASDTSEPYAVNDKAYAALLDLVTDICKRNGIKKLVWSTNKSDRVNHKNGCNMTVHRDYANKSCPGTYLYERHGAIADEVNKRLGSGGSTQTTTPTPTPSTSTTKKTATAAAQKFDKTLAGSYTVTASSGLHVRNDAKTSAASMVVLPKGTVVRNYGYYTQTSGVKWLYVQVTYQGVTYTGFSSSEYLKKK